MRAEVSSSLRSRARTRPNGARDGREEHCGVSGGRFDAAGNLCRAFLRTLLALNSVDAGFRTDHLLLFAINPPEQRYGAGKDVAASYAAGRGASGRFRASRRYRWRQRPILPTAFQARALSWKARAKVDGEGKAARHGEDFNVVGNDFFHTMGIPIAGWTWVWSAGYGHFPEGCGDQCKRWRSIAVPGGESDREAVPTDVVNGWDRDRRRLRRHAV
jgi:hypothetical protein